MMQTEHAIKIQTESFEGFESIFLNEEFALGWNCLFVLPVWLKSWWDVFGGNQDPEILTGYRHGKLIGVAPLHVEENTARFIGGENICDYQDMVVAPNHHQEFLEAVLSYLKKRGIQSLELGALRPESISLTQLPDVARRRGHTVVCDPAGISSEIALPGTWESYLQILGANSAMKFAENCGGSTKRVTSGFGSLNGRKRFQNIWTSFFLCLKRADRTNPNF